MTEHECALPDCTTMAHQYTLCDHHANTIVKITWINPNPTPHGGPTLTPLTTRHAATLATLATTHTRNALSRTIGISTTVLKRLEQSNWQAPLTPKTHRKIITYLTNPTPIPHTPTPQERRNNQLTPLELHHISILRQAVKHHHNQTTAAHTIGISTHTLTTWLHHKQPGDPVHPKTIRKILLWEAKHNNMTVPLSETPKGTGTLEPLLTRAVIKTATTEGHHRTAKGIGINQDTIRRLIDTPTRPVRGITRMKIARWVEAGKPIPPIVTVSSPSHHPRLTQYHLNIAHAALAANRVVYRTAQALHLSPQTMWALLDKKVGDTTTHKTIQKLEAWATHHMKDAA